MGQGWPCFSFLGVNKTIVRGKRGNPYNINVGRLGAFEMSNVQVQAKQKGSESIASIGRGCTPSHSVQTSTPLPVSAPSVTSAPTDDTLRECLIQASENARVYMDLRFKHFGTFVVFTGLLGTAAYQVAGLSAIRPSLAGVSFCLTALFWLLDFRTSQYFSDELHRISVFKQLLAVPPTNVPKHVVLLRASHATNLIFLTILVMWGIILIHFLSVS